ncbi:MAG: hypothetical protein HC905_03685 [Bacteroidales bacterium]|nr:hypothetical protein [Bacteroidales bacterium]
MSLKEWLAQLQKQTNDSIQNKIDDQFSQIPETLRSKIDSMALLIGMAYDSMKVIKPALYEK